MISVRNLLAALLLVATSVAFAQTPDAKTLVVAQSVDASTMDPADISSRTGANIAAHLWGSLVTTTSDGDLLPYFADSWTTSDDGTEITFNLVSGLTCHDGEPLTAVDAAYSFNRAADPALAFTGNTPGFIFSSLGFVEARADSDLDVTIVMDQKNPIALGLIGEVYIHCKDSYEAMSLDQAAVEPMGSGPYRFVEWVRDDRMVIERVEDFVLAQAGFDKIVWRVIPEASTRAAELMAGNVDIIANVSPDQIAAIEGSGKATVQAVSGTRRIYVGFNLRDDFAAATEGGAAIQKSEVRLALNHAVDVETICLQLLSVACERATSIVNPPNGNPALEPYTFDPELAETMLDDAGYPRGADGVRFTLALQAPNGRYLNDANVALAVGQYLTDIGVETKVELMDFASVFVPLIRAHDAGPLFLLGTGGATWSALYDMADLSAIDAGTNYTSWSNPGWFDRWADVNAAADEAERRAVINEMLEVFYNDPPWLLMYFQPDFYGVSDRIDWQARRDEKVIVTEAVLR